MNVQLLRLLPPLEQAPDQMASRPSETLSVIAVPDVNDADAAAAGADVDPGGTRRDPLAAPSARRDGQRRRLRRRRRGPGGVTVRVGRPRRAVVGRRDRHRRRRADGASSTMVNDAPMAPGKHRHARAARWRRPDCCSRATRCSSLRSAGRQDDGCPARSNRRRRSTESTARFCRRPLRRLGRRGVTVSVAVLVVPL